MPKGLKALAFTISEIPKDLKQHFLKTHFCLESGFLSLELQKSLLVTFQGCWTQWQRFESSSIHCFWDTPQHFLKTHFCLESDFCSFLELQKSLLVTFQRCWTQWQRFESSSIHCFWDTPQHFLKTHFCLESDLPSFRAPVPRAPEISTSEIPHSIFSKHIFRGAEHNGKDLKALAFTISEIPHSIFSKHISA